MINRANGFRIPSPDAYWTFHGKFSSISNVKLADHIIRPVVAHNNIDSNKTEGVVFATER